MGTIPVAMDTSPVSTQAQLANPNRAHLSIIPSQQTVHIGEEFEVAVRVEAETVPVVGADGLIDFDGIRHLPFESTVQGPVTGIDVFIDFDPAYLEVVNISGGRSLPMELANEHDNKNGHIAFSAGKLSGSLPRGTFTCTTIKLRAKAQTAGTGLDFSETRPRQTVVAGYGNKAITGQLTDAVVAIR